MDHRSVEVRLSIGRRAPGSNQAPNLRLHRISQNPDLLTVQGRKQVQSVWQKFVRNFGRSPRLIFADTFICLAWPLDLDVAATVEAAFGPNQIQIVSPFRPCPGIASMLIEVIDDWSRMTIAW